MEQCIPSLNDWLSCLTQMLMEALEGCDNLRVLELGYNPFGEEGIKAIADVMKYKLQVRDDVMYA